MQIKQIMSLITHQRPAAAIVAATSATVLAGAYGMQYFADIAPCQLCLYQRPPHAIAIMFAIFAFFAPMARWRAVALGVAGLALGVGAGIAFFHVGVEQHWWGGLASCSGPANLIEEAEALIKKMLGTEVARCDQIPWTLFHLSMAAYNAAISAGLAILAILGAFYTHQRNAEN